jgi:hypothetical protein
LEQGDDRLHVLSRTGPHQGVETVTPHGELMLFGRALKEGEIRRVFESNLNIPADAVWMS